MVTNATEGQANTLQDATAMNGKLIAVSLLDFDPKNPRFLDITVGAPQSADLSTKRMIEQETLEELVNSIGQQNYFPGEPLLVTPSETDGRYIVVEGNRRLAALRVLGNMVPETVMTRTIKDAVDRAIHKPSEVVCFVFAQRRDVLNHLNLQAKNITPELITLPGYTHPVISLPHLIDENGEIDPVSLCSDGHGGEKCCRGCFVEINEDEKTRCRIFIVEREDSTGMVRSINVLGFDLKHAMEMLIEERV